MTTYLPFHRAATTATRGVFEEGGLVVVEVYVVVVVLMWLCALCDVLQVVSLVFVLCLFVRCLFVCFVRWRFIFYGCTIWNLYYNMYALRCVGSKYVGII